MFPFLAIFITFCIILTYYLQKGKADQKKVDDAFWEKERMANSVRKKDISKLDYINIPLEKIPVKLDTSTEKNFFALAQKPMLNLTGISNTDLKLEYGTANLNVLCEYDENFTDMVALLPEYANELYEAGHIDTARELLEFAVNAKADSRKIYHQLATIYKESAQAEKLSYLETACETLPELTKNAIKKDLSSMN